MTYVTLGNTGITVNKNGFGALPVQRASVEDGVQILRRAYEGGIRYFDTARAYTDSEYKIGLALSDVRADIIIATKTQATTVEAFWQDLATSLEMLKTDYIDIYQFHNTPFCPKPGDGTGLYEAALEAKAQGKIRKIGFTNHRLNVAHEAIDSGLYETLQFPFCYLSGEKEEELIEKCEAAGMGFIAMKALSGGLLTNSAAAYAWLEGINLKGSLYRALQEYGIRAEKSIYDLSLTRLSAEEAAKLQAEEGTVVLSVEQVVYDQKGRPLHTSRQWIRGEKYTLKV